MNMDALLFYGGAVLSVVPSIFLTQFFWQRWELPLFKALTIYFAGAAAVNALVLLHVQPGWYPYFRIMHGSVLWYLWISLLCMHVPKEKKN